MQTPQILIIVHGWRTGFPIAMCLLQGEALKKYGLDLTEKAAQGKLDPVIGRDEEVRRALQVLSRRTKNNPVLIGYACMSPAHSIV
jgi:ATP-dependent Clp protease ATP-binding subunit ClpA